MEIQLRDELRNVDYRLLTSSVRPPRALITKEGWREFADHKPVERPPLLSVGAVGSWSKDDQARYKAIRRRYHAMLPPLSTPALSEISDTVVRMALNGIDMPPGVRPGALINGLPTLGKSTILTEIGRRYDKLLHQRLNVGRDADGDNEFIPVGYVTLASNETNKGLSAKLLDYYRCPYNPNDSDTRLAKLVAQGAEAAGTTLILVDDIHFLNMRNQAGVAVNTHLKALASAISATFVYAGVQVEGTGLLFEGSPEAKAQAAQTQRRFRRMDVHPFNGMEESFIALLRALEAQLLLLRAQPNDVVALAEYIFERTDGYIGAITSLIRDGASLAIETGAERMSRALLHRVVLDHASQKHYSVLKKSA